MKNAISYCLVALMALMIFASSGCFAKGAANAAEPCHQTAQNDDVECCDSCYGCHNLAFLRASSATQPANQWGLKIALPMQYLPFSLDFAIERPPCVKLS